jgi:hypothetical protein
MQPIERAILIALLVDMRAAGYEPAAVWDGEAYLMAGGAEYKQKRMRMHSSQSADTDAPDEITQPMTDDEVLDAVGSVDDPTTLHFTHHRKRTWGNRGALLILGNGEDIISDYHSPGRG